MYKTIQVNYNGIKVDCTGIYDKGEPPIWKPTFEIIETAVNTEDEEEILDLDLLTELCLEELRDE
jgi:hypothetical protein